MHAVVHVDIDRATIAEGDLVGAEQCAGGCEIRHFRPPALTTDQAAEIIGERSPKVGMAAEVGKASDTALPENFQDQNCG